MNILFVCLGNICRSPMAEAVFRKLVKERGYVLSPIGEPEKAFTIDSAGLIDYHEGELADSRMRKHASMRGYYLTHRSRPVEMTDFDRFDYIVGMDHQNHNALMAMATDGKNQHKVLEMASFLRHHESDTIPDPYYGGDRVFENVIDLLEDACEGLLDWLTQKQK